MVESFFSSIEFRKQSLMIRQIFPPNKKQDHIMILIWYCPIIDYVIFIFVEYHKISI